MFGLSTKEVLGKSILNATQNCIPQYKESVRHLIAGMQRALIEIETEMRREGLA